MNRYRYGLIVTKRPAGLAIEDLRALAVLTRSDSFAAAASTLGMPRAQLYRLVARVDRLAGRKLDWRVAGKFAPPPEVVRLADRRVWEQIGAALSFPRVAAGALAGLRFAEHLARQGTELPSIQICRASDTQCALKRREIDLALVHRFARAGGSDPPLSPGLTYSKLVGWSAVAVFSPNRIGQLRPVQWEQHSFADAVTDAARAASGAIDSLFAEIPPETAPWEGSSYLDAMEAARRSMPIVFVIPDVLLSEADQALSTSDVPLAERVTGSLSALYREFDRARLAPFIDTSIWRP